MTLVLENLAIACEIQVLPQPKAPGMAQVPPRTDGNRESKTLYPVNKGTFPTNLLAKGLGFLTGQK